jgi:hypothetical protein
MDIYQARHAPVKFENVNNENPVSNPGGPLRAAVKAVWDYVHGFAEGGTDFMMKSDKELLNYSQRHNKWCIQLSKKIVRSGWDREGVAISNLRNARSHDP